MVSTPRKTTTTARRLASVATEATADGTETGASDDAAAGPTALRKKELIDRVVALSGLKKKDVKPVVEATLAVMGAALSNDETMNLPPLGKLVINRKKEMPNGDVLIMRLRRAGPGVATDATEAETDGAAIAEPVE